MQEFQLLERVFAHNVSLPACVVVPPGDDMAALRLPPQTSTILVAADSAVEGRHTPVGVDAYILGRKAVLRNLSDVAAMANARPFATLACAMIPVGTEEARVWRLFEGLRETALQWNAPLVGGDMTAATAKSSAQNNPKDAAVCGSPSRSINSTPTKNASASIAVALESMSEGAD